MWRVDRSYGGHRPSAAVVGSPVAGERRPGRPEHRGPSRRPPASTPTKSPQPSTSNASNTNGSSIAWNAPRSSRRRPRRPLELVHERAHRVLAGVGDAHHRLAHDPVGLDRRPQIGAARPVAGGEARPTYDSTSRLAVAAPGSRPMRDVRYACVHVGETGRRRARRPGDRGTAASRRRCTRSAGRRRPRRRRRAPATATW